MTCHSCGGRLGVDCFNPTECGDIARQQEVQQQQDIQDSQEHAAYLQAIVTGLERHIHILYKRVSDLEERLGVSQ